MITVGGIATKPRYLNGQLEPRELLELTSPLIMTSSTAPPAARFARRLAELVEAAEGLDTVSWAGHESNALGAR